MNNTRDKRIIRFRKWKSKKLDKPSFRNKEGGKIKPIRKFCKRCKVKRVKFHHSYCNKCYDLNRIEKENGTKLIPTNDN